MTIFSVWSRSMFYAAPRCLTGGATCSSRAGARFRKEEKFMPGDFSQELCAVESFKRLLAVMREFDTISAWRLSDESTAFIATQSNLVECSRYSDADCRIRLFLDVA